MLKLTSNLESFLLHKGFSLLHTDQYQHWVKNFEGESIEIYLTDLSETGVEYGALIRVLDKGQPKMESTFNIKTAMDILHVEAFLNMHLPANYPFPKD